jgi:acetolactate synthase-1/3 small subunit
MSNDTLTLNIDRADGSLQRLIGLVERRGFHIDGMALRDEGAARRVEMTVRARDANRCPRTLGRQIDRLFGITRVAAQVSGPAAVCRPEVAA